MAERNVERAAAAATGAPARVLRARLASAFRGGELMIFLAGAAVMAAFGALAGAQLGMDELEVGSARGPHLRVLAGQGGKASVTIP